MTTVQTVARTARSRRRRSPTSPSAVWLAVFLLPTLMIFGLIYAIPIVTVVMTSFTDWTGFSSPNFVGFRNYVDLVGDREFRIAIRNSLIWGALAAGVHVPLGVYVALTLHRRPFGWRLVRAISLLPNLVPPAALALLYFFLFNPGVGLINELVRTLGFEDFTVNWFFEQDTAFVAVTSAWLFYAGVIILITLAELARIPSELTDAAVVDGASARQVDWYIYLPQLKGVIGVGIIIAVTEVFKLFDSVFLTTGGGPNDETMSLGLLIYNAASVKYEYGSSNAAGVVLLAMGLATFLAVSRMFGLGKSADR